MSDASTPIDKDLSKPGPGLPEAQSQILRKEVVQLRAQLGQLRAQLGQQSKMAALGTLVAGVAHDINTPLGSIKANAELANKLAHRIRKRTTADDDPKLKRSLDALDSSMSTLGLAAERVLVIVQSLRTFARDGDKHPVDSDLHAGLDNSLLLVSHMFEGRITADKHYGSIPPVRCRAGEINQVFMNLLTNAVQAIEGEGTVTVTTRLAGLVAEIAIQDSGVGISQEDQAKLFDPGFTTKEASSGTGLGLSITGRIVREHGGTMSVVSQPGKGACFTVRLPVAGPPTESVDSNA